MCSRRIHIMRICDGPYSLSERPRFEAPSPQGAHSAASGKDPLHREKRTPLETATLTKPGLRPCRWRKPSERRAAFLPALACA